MPPPLAADSLGLHATLVTLGDSVPGDPDYQVRLPQVQLPNAAAASRINAVLVQHLAEVADTVLPALSGQAVRLARPMLRNHSGGNASGSLLYEVRYNAHGLLSLAFTVNQPGASIEDVHHLTFDLGMGRQLRPADLVAQPRALARSLAKRCAARKAETLQAIAEALPDDPDMQAQLAGIVGEMDAVPLADFDFYLTRHGLVFFNLLTKNFPHPYYNLAPEPEYRYSFAELRPWRQQHGAWRAPARQRI
ncbi:hypothetical protein QMK33_18940 [Hymenobacter sp. H14-R3]|uniref:hypothetical protein n=1 Tax=Hymenobacter sp. H14-R3 TaxID=3046308 RepID=UPI0024B93E4B|nr:hypothetical protein [Hymenobacter sp. H14-R3]MDJ0367230.1 hypothetical protein [Hymenobacter sp. H14-R3]